MPDDELPLLNVFEVHGEGEDEGRTRHLLTFTKADRAAEQGIEPRAIVGEVTPTDYGGYIPESLLLNPDFVAAFTSYMNEVVARTAPIIQQAKENGQGWVYVVDPRNRDEPGAQMHASDLMGTFAVDEEGNIVPDSFDYNANHAMIHPERGVSGILSDRQLYDRLNTSQPDQ